MLLVRRALIGVPRRGHDTVDTERHHVVEETGDPLRLSAIEEGAVDREPESALLGGLDGAHGAVVDAVLAHRAVVHFLVAIEVDVPREELVRLEQVHLLLEQQRVRAEIDELLSGQDALDDLRQLLMQKRLTAGDRDHGRAALIDRGERVGDRKALVQNFVRVVDLPAAGTGEVATKQRLQHQHERIALAANQMLLHDIGADAQHLVHRDGHA